MSGLFSFSNVQLSLLFQSWLEVIDYVRLDSSICSHGSRPRFLLITESYKQPENEDFHCYNSYCKGYMLWSVNKKIQLKYLLISDEKTSLFEMAVFIASDTCKVGNITSLYISEGDDSSIVYENIPTIVNKCINLKSLSLESSLQYFGEQIDQTPISPDILNQLTSLRIHEHGNESRRKKYKKTIFNTVCNCHNLTELKMYYTTFWKKEYSEIIKRNPNLTRIDIQEHGDGYFLSILTALMENLPKLRYFSFEGEESCTLKDGLKFINHFQDKITFEHATCGADFKFEQKHDPVTKLLLSRHIQIGNSSESYPLVSNTNLIKMFKNLKKLTSLFVRFVVSTGHNCDAVVNAVVTEHSSTLNTCRFVDCHHYISLSAITYLLTECKMLRKLDFFRCRYNLVALRELFPHVEITNSGY
jgi:hypothetical protein